MVFLFYFERSDSERTISSIISSPSFDNRMELEKVEKIHTRHNYQAGNEKNFENVKKKLSTGNSKIIVVTEIRFFFFFNSQKMEKYLLHLMSILLLKFCKFSSFIRKQQNQIVKSPSLCFSGRICLSNGSVFVICLIFAFQRWANQRVRTPPRTQKVRTCEPEPRTSKNYIFS